jgi:hypothetical protein
MKKQKNKIKFFIGSTIALIVCLCIFLWFVISNKPYTHEELINRIKDDTGLVISDNYKVIYFEEDDSGFRPKWIAKIEVPEELKRNIIGQIMDKSVAGNSYSSNRVWSAAIKWWKPQKTIITKRYRLKSNETIYIAVSEDNNGVFLYIECYGYFK